MKLKNFTIGVGGIAFVIALLALALSGGAMAEFGDTQNNTYIENESQFNETLTNESITDTTLYLNQSTYNITENITVHSNNITLENGSYLNTSVTVNLTYSHFDTSNATNFATTSNVTLVNQSSYTDKEANGGGGTVITGDWLNSLSEKELMAIGGLVAFIVLVGVYAKEEDL